MGHRHYSLDEVQAFKEKIIESLFNGKSLFQILKKRKNMPSRTLVYEWLNPNSATYDVNFANNYSMARENSADIDFEKLEKLADDVLKGKIEPSQARAAAFIIKWIAGKKKPKKYGNQLDITTNGKEFKEQVTVFKIPDNARNS